MYTNIEIFEIIILSVQTNVIKNTTTSKKTCNLPFVAFTHLFSLFVAFIQRFPSIHQ